MKPDGMETGQIFKAFVSNLPLQFRTNCVDIILH